MESKNMNSATNNSMESLEESFHDLLSTCSDDSTPIICHLCHAEDPSTLAGQQVGAILVIKSLTQSQDRSLQVGDHVRLTSFDSEKVAYVESLRGGFRREVPWANFFPVPYGGKCVCAKGECRCLYESKEEFYVGCLI